MHSKNYRKTLEIDPHHYAKVMPQNNAEWRRLSNVDEPCFALFTSDKEEVNAFARVRLSVYLSVC